MKWAAIDWAGLTLLAFLLAPHVLLGTAWVQWALSPQKFALPRWRGVSLLSALVACSLGLVTFWAFVYWMRFHHRDLLWWHRRDQLELLAGFFACAAVIAALAGKGRGRVAVVIGAIAAYFMWIVFHVGVL
jgi:hypothetical protein